MAESILIVDDDEELLNSLKRSLGRKYQIHTANSAAKGLELLARSGPFAVVISDLHMPVMDGRELLEKMRSVSPDTVRIMFTGSADREMVIQALNDGYLFRFLDKPCSTGALQKAIDQGLEQYRLIWDQRELHSLKRHKTALEGVVLGFTRLVENRDPYTAGHQTRVAGLSQEIAREMSLSGDVVDGIRIAAMVHDLGKIYVPAEFLNRPGRLSDMEFTIIRAHPEVGYDILRHISFGCPVADFVLQHHERADGSGYPQGLKASQIHQESAIIAVADVVEAMYSHRPYRPALGMDSALEEIKNHQRDHFQPEVVEACLAVFERGYTFAEETPATA